MGEEEDKQRMWFQAVAQPQPDLSGETWSIHLPESCPYKGKKLDLHTPLLVTYLFQATLPMAPQVNQAPSLFIFPLVRYLYPGITMICSLIAPQSLLQCNLSPRPPLATLTKRTTLFPTLAVFMPFNLFYVFLSTQYLDIRNRSC